MRSDTRATAATKPTTRWQLSPAFQSGDNTLARGVIPSRESQLEPWGSVSVARGRVAEVKEFVDGLLGRPGVSELVARVSRGEEAARSGRPRGNGRPAMTEGDLRTPPTSDRRATTWFDQSVGVGPGAPR